MTHVSKNTCNGYGINDSESVIAYTARDTHPRILAITWFTTNNSQNKHLDARKKKLSFFVNDKNYSLHAAIEFNFCTLPKPRSLACVFEQFIMPWPCNTLHYSK